MSHRTRYLAFSLLASWMLLSAPAAAQAPVDDATRATARALAEDGLARFDRGDHAGALPLFDKADALIHAPTMGLMAARCLEKIGRWVEASERFLAVSRIKLDAAANDAQRNAVRAAEVERQALLPRIPMLVLNLEGAAPEEVALHLDGQPLPSAMIGVKRPTDPGKHRIEARRGAERQQHDATLVPGAVVNVNLRFGAGAGSPPPLDSAPPAVKGTSGGAMKGLGFAALGVGGAGIITGAILGGLAISAKGKLDEQGCDGGKCPASLTDDVSRYNTFRMASGGALIAGIVLAAGGVTLAALAPSDKGAEKDRKAAALRWEPWVGAGMVGVRGVF